VYRSRKSKAKRILVLEYCTDLEYVVELVEQLGGELFLSQVVIICMVSIVY
jgi:hypothetical protein